MNRPRPKAEIAIKKFQVARALCITTYSSDAREWVEEEAPGFGTLSLSAPAKFWCKYNLQVGDGYNIDEVAVWLESQGDP